MKQHLFYLLDGLKLIAMGLFMIALVVLGVTAVAWAGVQIWPVSGILFVAAMFLSFAHALGQVHHEKKIEEELNTRRAKE